MTNKSESKKGVVPALLVIDVQNRYLPVIPERDKGTAIFFINLLIGLFRKRDFPVIRIYHHNKEIGPRSGTAEFEYTDSVKVKPALKTMITKPLLQKTLL